MKCWLDDKLESDKIETRVPIYAVDDINRKFEFSLLERSNGIAISYHYERASLSDEKLEILDSNSKGIKTLYFIDKKNAINNVQYPERLMKVQKRQGYCILLEVGSTNYYDAKVKVVFYTQDARALWREVKFIEGFLKDFSFGDNNELLFENKRIETLLYEAKEKFLKEVEEERFKIKEEEKLLAEKLERERLREKAKRIEEENYKKQLKSVSEKLPKNSESTDIFPQVVVCSKDVESFDFSMQDKKIKNEFGDRLYKCRFCGKVSTSNQFDEFGGRGEINNGICKECFTKSDVQEIIYNGLEKKDNSDVCPKCGGKLVKRSGRFGVFKGCSNFPKCKYTKSIR